MKFIDQIQIIVQAGKGGDGLTSFMRAKYLPKLGPDGGDGGNGGSVYLVGSEEFNSLSHLNYNKMYKAQDGEKGGPNGRTGKDGDDLEIPVPLGTTIIDAQNNRVISEITQKGQKVCVAKGGRRGLGNKHFASSTHQAPQEHTCGEKGEVLILKLELKLIADIGLVGLVNAGKSTLLSKISAAKPAIGDYPFTTLTPHIGVVKIEDHQNYITKTFSVADIPGLIKDASKGKGLGCAFLKHIERTKVLCFVIDGFSHEDNKIPKDTFKILYTELKKYNPDLLKKPSLVVINKIDLAKDSQQIENLKRYFIKKGYDHVVCISAAKEIGLENLKNEMLKILESYHDMLKSSKVDININMQNRPQLSNYKLIKTGVIK